MKRRGIYLFESQNVEHNKSSPTVGTILVGTGWKEECGLAYIRRDTELCSLCDPQGVISLP